METTKRKVDKRDIEMFKYNKQFDSTGMLTIREVYRRLESKDMVLLEYNTFFGYLIEFGVFVKCRLFGKETYCVSEKYSELIKTKIWKNKVNSEYFFIYLLTDDGLKWLLSLMEEMEIINQAKKQNNEKII